MYEVTEIYFTDKKSLAQVDSLLEREGIRRDKNLDYLCGIFDADFQLLATGGCFRNTLRCFAVDSARRGEGLLNELVSHLVEVQFERGNSEIFLYTKISTAKFFSSLGFYEIARVADEVVFMENQKNNFAAYLKKIQQETPPLASNAKIAAVVLNANPFTLGHKFLVETAARENDFLHVFIVSEDLSEIPFVVRKKLVEAGTKNLDNVACHDSGAYIISSATFPDYFQRDFAEVNRSHALLDAVVFEKIAQALKISRRYVGEEPLSAVTNLYNRILQETLPAAGIKCSVIPRLKVDGEIVSASRVRELLQQKNFVELKKFVPESTWRFFHEPKS